MDNNIFLLKEGTKNTIFQLKAKSHHSATVGSLADTKAKKLQHFSFIIILDKVIKFSPAKTGSQIELSLEYRVVMKSNAINLFKFFSLNLTGGTCMWPSVILQAKLLVLRLRQLENVGYL